MYMDIMTRLCTIYMYDAFGVVSTPKAMGVVEFKMQISVVKNIAHAYMYLWYTGPYMHIYIYEYIYIYMYLYIYIYIYESLSSLSSLAGEVKHNFPNRV